MREARAIRIAICALGGQGGGVLSGWIVRAGERAGFIVQSTSVPGVAQRTGATIYYIELFPNAAAEKSGKPPVLALMPVPGDVDVVLASELMEAGRAVVRGLVSDDTTLIASSHRDYAISEKIAMSDGRQDDSAVIQSAKDRAGRFIIGDMQAAADEAGAVISAVMLGALAGSGSASIARVVFEDVIRESGRAVERNLAAFENGWAMATAEAWRTQVQRRPDPSPHTASGSAATPLLERMCAEFPAATQTMVFEGLKRAVDFQDPRYGGLYLDRIGKICALDSESHGWRMTLAVAKHLALWMTYEDAVRVADLKTRASRFERFREDVRAEQNQIVHVSEYLHPRAEEVCDLLPPALARRILGSTGLRKLINNMLGGGRRISTTKLRGFLVLNFLASLRFMRRSSYRYAVEQARIDEWLSLIAVDAGEDYSLACEIAALQKLLKGYGETHERGRAGFEKIVATLDAVRAQPDPPAALGKLRDAAFADEEGVALRAALNRLEQQTVAA